jgi:hypothetical protein
MEGFPLYGGRISPDIAEGFPLLSWKDLGNCGSISPRIVEEFPPIRGRISPGDIHDSKGRQDHGRVAGALARTSRRSYSC